MASTLATVSILGASPAKALSFTANLQNFTGDNAGGRITVSDSGTTNTGLGIVELLAEITAPTVNGDINGIFFDLAPVSSDLDINSIATIVSQNGNVSSGVSVNTRFEALAPGSGCPNLGGGNNLNGGGNPCPLNVGVAIGAPGAAGGRITSALLTLTGTGLDATDFGNTFGLRFQSTGVNTQGSSKLGGTADDVVPTPAAVLPALLGMGAAVTRKKKEQAEAS